MHYIYPVYAKFSFQNKVDYKKIAFVSLEFDNLWTTNNFTLSQATACAPAWFKGKGSILTAEVICSLSQVKYVEEK